MKIKQKIGQLSVEATTIFIFVMIALAAIIVFLPIQLSKLSVIDDRKIAQQTIQKIANEVDYIYIFGEGASKEIKITLPQSINYNLSYIGSPPHITDWNLKKEIRIVLKDGQIFSITTSAPVCGNFPLKIGESQIKIEYNTSSTPHVMVNSNC